MQRNNNFTVIYLFNFLFSMLLCHPEIQSHHPEIQNHHPEIQSHHPEIQSRHPEIQSHHPEIQSHHLETIMPNLPIKIAKYYRRDVAMQRLYTNRIQQKRCQFILTPFFIWLKKILISSSVSTSTVISTTAVSTTITSARISTTVVIKTSSFTFWFWLGLINYDSTTLNSRSV